MAINCAIYIRKSTEKGLEQEFNSLNNQEEACKAYIISQSFNRWLHFKTYEDGGISGGTMNRPGLQQMLDDMKEGKIQVVVVYKVDRLSRSIMDFHNMMKEFEKHNCNFVSITQSFDTSNSMGKLTLNMLLSFAQFEREVSAERVRDKIAASKAKGFWTGGNYPLGYDVVDKNLVVNQKEAKLVRQIFDKYLEEEKIRYVVDWLNDNGHKTKILGSRGGSDFSKSIVDKLLKNKKYIGVIDDKKHKKEYNGRHEAIIDKETFEKVQNLLSRHYKNNLKRKNYTKSTYLLENNFYTEDSAAFKFTNSKKHAQRFNYYFVKGLYLPTEQIDMRITTALGFLGLSQMKLKKYIFKVVYSVQGNFSELEIQVKIDENIGKFKKPKNAEFSLDNKYLIVKTQFVISNQTSTKINGYRGKNLLSIAEINEQIIKALSYGWHYRKLWEQGLSIDEIALKDKISERTVQKYKTLTFLSPRIIEDIFNYRNPGNITLTELISISSGYVDFYEQEQRWYVLK